MREPFFHVSESIYLGPGKVPEYASKQSPILWGMRCTTGKGKELKALSRDCHL
jgi:hypothetical protein